jgi:hypothetical protein
LKDLFFGTVGNYLAELTAAFRIYNDMVPWLNPVMVAKVKMVELPQLLEANTDCVSHFLSRSTGLRLGLPRDHSVP